MDRADNVLALGMINSGMRENLIQPLVADPLVSAKQADFGRNGFFDEFGLSGRLGIGDNSRHDITLSLDAPTTIALPIVGPPGPTPPPRLSLCRF